jgi:hypothetical protein
MFYKLIYVKFEFSSFIDNVAIETLSLIKHSFLLTTGTHGPPFKNQQLFSV